MFPANNSASIRLIIKKSRRLASAIAALMLLASLVNGTPGAPADPGGSRVSVQGGAITLDGRPWWPSGFDAYQLGTNWSVNQGCGAQVDLDRYFAALPPHSLTRFNVFAPLARNDDTGATDFGPLDAVFAAAQRHDQFVVAVLSSGEGACDDGGFKNALWYAGGWAKNSYVRWLDTAVGRWGGSSALAGWELVGEPEPVLCADEKCVQRSCPPDAAAILRGFFDAAGARLRALDPDTPIWEGLAGGGQCGSAADDYVTVGQSPFIDVLDVHDYGPPGVALPGNEADGMQRRLRQAAAMGKPLVVAEMGQYAGSCRSLADRAADMSAKVTAQRQAGTAGVLFWAFVPDPRLNDCTRDIGPDDPLFGVLRALPR